MRHILAKDNTAIAFGIDHAVGLFLQVWNINPELPMSHIDNIIEAGNVMFDKDYLFDDLKEEEFQATLKKYGFKPVDTSLL